MPAASPAAQPERDMPLLTVRNLRKYFAVRAERLLRPPLQVQAVDDVSFEIAKGEKDKLETSISGALPSTRARRWALSANPAAANRPRRGC